MLANQKWLVINADKPISVVLLICFHIGICCVSLVYASYFTYPFDFNGASYHIFYDQTRLYCGVVAVTAFALVAFLFAFVGFSFGYFIGFYFYIMILGYLWLNCFSDLIYNHQLAGLSAASSAVGFLVLALLISAPIPQTYVMSTRALEYLLTFILL